MDTIITPMTPTKNLIDRDEVMNEIENYIGELDVALLNNFYIILVCTQK